MANFYPKQSGTTLTSFAIGAGHGKSPFLLDASALYSPITWVIPSNYGSLGDILTTDGSGGLSWASAGSASVSGSISGDNDLGLLGQTIIAKVDFGAASSMPYSISNMGTL